MRHKFSISTICAILAPLAPAFAEDVPLPDFQQYTPRITAVQIEEREKPQLDGDLSDPVWQRAEPVKLFYTVSPEEGETPPDPTHVSFVYDDSHLYIGIMAFDSSPEDIKASVMTRDTNLFRDDAVYVILDPSNTRRDGYFLAVNPNGARQDALIENNDRTLHEWDMIWQAKGRQTGDGWSAEIAIPFRSLSFDAASNSWGLQLARRFRDENILVRWSNISISRAGIDLSNIGRLDGIKPQQQGRGLDVELLGSVIHSAGWEKPRDSETSFEPSANLYYRLTPQMTGTLTLNTDFSDTPLDSRQVNTGRFSLFFPETRDFFLQDANVFEFGGKNFNRVNGLPFFSRRIGIVEGEPADLVAGGKLSGRAGPYSVGALLTRTGDSENWDGQLLAALRVSRTILDGSRAGLIFTSGDPSGKTDSQTAGFDFQYRNDGRLAPGVLTADFVNILTSNKDKCREHYTEDVCADDERLNPGEEQNGAMSAVRFNYRGDEVFWNAMARDIDEDYDPRLGFVNRTGIRRYRLNGARIFRPEDSFFRRWELGAFGNLVTDRQDRIEDQNFGIWFFGMSPAGDEIFAEYENGFTVIPEAFDIADIVTVPMGKYRYDAWRLNMEGGSTRPVAPGLFLEAADFYDGNFWRVSPELNLRPNKHVSFGLDYDWRRFDLPGGELDIRIATMAADIAFATDMLLDAELQWDNISEDFSLFGRFRWEPTPAREVTLSLGHSATLEEEDFPRRFVSNATSFSLRIGQTLRF